MLESNSLAYASTNERQITLYELFDRYLESLNKTSADSIKYYINDFKNYMKNDYLINITVDNIQDLINYKRCMLLKDTTIYRYYRMLKTIFNYAVSHDYIDKNPCERC